MSRPLRLFTIVFLPLLTLVLGWQVGVMFERQRLESQFERLEILYSGETGNSQLLQDPEQEVNIGLLWAVWRLLLHNYLEPEHMQTDTMVFGAVSGLVDAVGDPYTVFMTPQENTEFFQSLQGNIEGIGIQITMREQQVVVIAPLKGSPAAEAGFKSEDIVVEVDGVDVTSESLDEVVHRIRGEKGTEVTVGVFRPSVSDIIQIPVIRDEIKIPNVSIETLEYNEGIIGYVSLNRFGENSIEEVHDALKSHKEAEVDGLILDLRYNGGGLLEGAVRLVSQFLSHGKVVSVQRRGDVPENHYVYGTPVTPDLPLVVLINEGSASAAEITAGALRDHGRATLIGATTFGKGTVQEIIDLPGGSSLRVTTSKWVTPSGTDLGESGIEPDMVVEISEEDAEQKIDTQREAAVHFLLGVHHDQTPKTGSGEIVDDSESE